MARTPGRPKGKTRERRTDEDFQAYLEEGRKYLHKFFSDRSDLSGMKQNEVEKNKGSEEYIEWQANLRKFRDEISKRLGEGASQQKKNEEWKKVWLASQEQYMLDTDNNPDMPAIHQWKFCTYVNDYQKDFWLSRYGTYLEKDEKKHHDPKTGHLKDSIVRGILETLPPEPLPKLSDLIAKKDLAKIAGMDKKDLIMMAIEVDVNEKSKIVAALDSFETWFSEVLKPRLDALKMAVSFQ
jgi:hypothetical protein